jgi:hypothetical protein
MSASRIACLGLEGIVGLLNNSAAEEMPRQIIRQLLEVNDERRRPIPERHTTLTGRNR